MTKCFTGKNQVSLEEVLKNRDKRRDKIKKNLKTHQDKIIISYKLNIPGPEKINESLVALFDKGLEEIIVKINESSWNYELAEMWEEKTGKEAILLVSGDGLEVKKSMVDLEDGSKIGRLFDIDVISKDGYISRRDLKLELRRCLICGGPVTICSRSRRHSVKEMQEYIEKILEDCIK